jgi:hypothetical protein
MAAKTRKWRKNQRRKGQGMLAPSEPFCGHGFVQTALEIGCGFPEFL